MDDIDRCIAKECPAPRANVNKHGGIHIGPVIHIRRREKILFPRREYINISSRYLYSNTFAIRRRDRCICARLPKILGSIDLYEG